MADRTASARPGVGAQWLIAALVALGPFSLTMYQPALPSIATSLNITTAQVQLTSPSDGSSSLSTAIRFGMSLGGEARNPVEVAAWMSEAFHKAARDSIAGDHPIGMVPARTGIRTS